jgi:flagellar biosynthesis GTPase FlhF
MIAALLHRTEAWGVQVQHIVVGGWLDLDYYKRKRYEAQEAEQIKQDEISALKHQEVEAQKAARTEEQRKQIKDQIQKLRAAQRSAEAQISLIKFEIEQLQEQERIAMRMQADEDDLAIILMCL